MKSLLITLLTFFSYSIYSQVDITTEEDLIQYISGEWQLTEVSNGWGGLVEFPNDSIDVLYKFESIENSTTTLLCSGYLNDELIQTTTVNIISPDNLSWGLENLPQIPDFLWPNLYIEDWSLAVDSFSLWDAWFDGTTINLSRIDGATLTENIGSDVGFSIYPNPCKEQIFIKSPKLDIIKSYHVFDMKGRLVGKGEYNHTSGIQLPPISGQFVLKILLENGDVVTGTFAKI